MIRFTRDQASVWLLALAAFATWGCEKKMTFGNLGNQLPEVTITQAPIDTTVVCTPGPSASCYSVTVSWIGFDPDGQVDRYRYCVDPPSKANSDTVWQTTRSNQVRLLLSAGENLTYTLPELPRARDYHVFVVQAVDNRNAYGPSESRAFFAYTQAPDVYVSDPLPSSFSIPTLTPSVRIRWHGQDDDGVLHTAPIKYKYTLLTASSEFSVGRALRDPDSLRMYYAPNFSSWDSVSGDTTLVQYNNLSPDQEYLFVVVAFDEAGAYSPIFLPTKNMLRFRVGFAGTLGPKISMFSEFFEYTWRSSYCPSCASSEFLLEMPTGRPLTVGWSSQVSSGGDVKSYRWALDIEDVSDDTERTGPNDLSHWSTGSLNMTSVTLGPFTNGGEQHRLYVEASDNLGLRSLAVLKIQVIGPDWRTGSILVVDDCRFKVDALVRATGCTEKPKGPWPTAAELDTFLFARGGVPWRCYVPATLSKRGIFYGYPFDTMSTRIRKSDLTVRLFKLARYQHVIWITDIKGAQNGGGGDDPSNPQTALTYMNGPGRFNSLAAYVKLGGKVWLVGGGTAYASTIGWDKGGNNQPFITFSNELGELIPNHFMYDVPAWRSSFRSTNEFGVVKRFAGRYENNPDTSVPYQRYINELPARMELKTSATDTLPPYRTPGDLFFPSTVQLEYLLTPNSVAEDVDPDPDHNEPVSTLDTLYEATGIASAGNQVRPAVMTYAHGPSVPQGVVMTGFDLWSFRRAHAKAVVDFVLRRMWGLSPSSSPPAASLEMAPLNAPRPRPRVPEAARASAAPGRVTTPGRILRTP